MKYRFFVIITYMKKFIILIILVVSLFINYWSINCSKLDKTYFYHDSISIDKINLKQDIYSYKYSSVDDGIIMLKESDFNKNFYILAAHSGNSSISYFKNINKLEKGDELEVIIGNKKMKFKVVEKYYEKKNGSIHIHKNNINNYLYLTTCDKYRNDYQLVIKCLKI